MGQPRKGRWERTGGGEPGAPAGCRGRRGASSAGGGVVPAPQPGSGPGKGSSRSPIVPSPQLNPLGAGARPEAAGGQTGPRRSGSLARNRGSVCRGDSPGGGGRDQRPVSVPPFFPGPRSPPGGARRCASRAAPSRGALRRGGTGRGGSRGASAFPSPTWRRDLRSSAARRRGAGPGGGVTRGAAGGAGEGAAAAAEDGGVRVRVVLLLLPALLRRAGEPHPRGAGTAAARPRRRCAGSGERLRVGGWGVGVGGALSVAMAQGPVPPPQVPAPQPALGPVPQGPVPPPPGRCLSSRYLSPRSARRLAARCLRRRLVARYLSRRSARRLRLFPLFCLLLGPVSPPLLPAPRPSLSRYPGQRLLWLGLVSQPLRLVPQPALLLLPGTAPLVAVRGEWLWQGLSPAARHRRMLSVQVSCPVLPCNLLP